MPYVKVEQWPHDALEVKENKKGDATVTVFRPKTLTISRVISGTGSNGPYTAWQFEGDTTPVTGKDGKSYKGAAWWAQGEWSEAEGKSLPYNGPKFLKGQRVNAELNTRETQDGKINYSVARIEAVSQEQVANEQRADDAGYDDYVNKRKPAGTIGPDDKIPPAWELPKSYHERIEIIKRESIERQQVLTANGTLIAALAAIKSPPEWVEKQVAHSLAIFNRLSDQLAPNPPVPQAVPPEEAGKDDDKKELPW